MMCFLEAMRDLRAADFMQAGLDGTRRAHAGELAEMRTLRISVAAW
jgi:hypothetical protein